MDKEQLTKIKQAYNCDETVAEQILRLAETADVKPHKGMIELLPFNKKDNRGQWTKTFTPMLTIGALRAIAQSTGVWAGLDPIVFSDKVVTFKGKAKRDGAIPEYTAPEWGQMTIYKMVQGQRVPFPSPKLYFREFWQDKDMWEKKTIFMFEKNIEASALRRAFPEKILSEDFDRYIPEELDEELSEKLEQAKDIDTTGLDELNSIGKKPVESKPLIPVEKAIPDEQDIENLTQALRECENKADFDEMARSFTQAFIFTDEQRQKLGAIREEKGFN